MPVHLKSSRRWIAIDMRKKVLSIAVADGFTIVELLVAMGVLILMVVMVTQLTNSATSTVTNSGKLIDADSQARMVFDRMANDFSRMIKRKDVDYIFAKQAGNDAFFFYSESPSYYDVTPSNSEINSVSLVGYRINPGLQLERFAKGLLWDASTSGTNAGGVVFLTYPSGSATPDPLSTLGGNSPGIGTYVGTFVGAYSDGMDTHYHVIGDQIYRLEICFLLTNGIVSLIPITSPTSTINNLTASSPPVATDDITSNYSRGSRWYDTIHGRGYICMASTAGAAVWSPIGIQDVSAVIVAIAVLDGKSREIVTNTSQLVNALADPKDTDLSSNPPKLMASTWLTAINSRSFANNSAIPKAAASQVRVYQRYFYLNNQ
jgi:type II secretory pathway pseudopilin PulG